MSVFIDVFDLKTKEYAIRNSTIKNAALAIDIPYNELKNCFYKYKQRISRKRYLIVKTGESVDTDYIYNQDGAANSQKPSIPQKLLDDWDTVRMKINPNARG